MKQTRGEQARTPRRPWVAVALACGALSGCDGLLDVNLPAQLTDEALEDPAGAEVQILTVIAHFEDAYDLHTYRKLGREDGGEVYLCGPMCNVSHYVTANPSFDRMSTSLRFNREIRGRLTSDWTVQQVPQRDRFLAITSIYEGATLGWMGSNMCEVALNGGPLLTPEKTLEMADAALTRALTEIGTTGDFALPSGITSSARNMAYGLRAQVRWMAGNKAGALADAQQIPKGFVAWATRDVGVTSTSQDNMTRQNRGWTSGTGGGFFELYDPIDWWTGKGLPNPVTGRPWPNVIPFTGWTYLGILPDGRAVREDGIPIRHRVGPAPWMNAHGVTAGAVPDPRVPHMTRQIQGKQAVGEVPAKYTGQDSDIALVNWKEMVLIRAELEGGQRAIDLVNELRADAGLPQVTYADPNNPEQIRYMIIEERRRALFYEARFFYTKLKNLDLLWFPRRVGGTRVQNHIFQGGIRYTMPEGEYVANVNLSTADMATGCAPNERPVGVF